VSKKGIVKIHGREYKTVARRVAEFHQSKEGFERITTELVFHDENRVVMKATVWNADVPIGTGYGEEWRESSKINKTSAMENAETSAIGRALACIGLGGDEYASADEVLRAISQQEEMEQGPTLTKEIDKEDESWDSDIPDDILEIVKENFTIIKKRNKDMEPDGPKWHRMVLSNYLDVKGGDNIVNTIKELSREQLFELSQYQNDMIKLNKGDD